MSRALRALAAACWMPVPKRTVRLAEWPRASAFLKLKLAKSLFFPSHSVYVHSLLMTGRLQSRLGSDHFRQWFVYIFIVFEFMIIYIALDCTALVLHLLPSARPGSTTANALAWLVPPPASDDSVLSDDSTFASNVCSSSCPFRLSTSVAHSLFPILFLFASFLFSLLLHYYR